MTDANPLISISILLASAAPKESQAPHQVRGDGDERSIGDWSRSRSRRPGHDHVAVIGKLYNQAKMDRRKLLALATALPALACTPARSCSVALKGPRSAGLENEQIRKLFSAWWDRDKAGFQGIFNDTLMSDGSPMEKRLAAELRSSSPLPANTFDIFDHFFTDQRKQQQIKLIINTDAGVIVACSEQDRVVEIQSDCSGLPSLHLFLVDMAGLNPRIVTHLATTQTAEPGKFSIWSDA